MNPFGRYGAAKGFFNDDDYRCDLRIWMCDMPIDWLSAFAYVCDQEVEWQYAFAGDCTYLADVDIDSGGVVDVA